MREPPSIPDHILLRKIGAGSYGEVWLARNVMGTHRAVKIVYRDKFENEKPFEREFSGIQNFEPISRSHESQVHVLHIGKGDGFFYYVMELGDDLSGRKEKEIAPDSYQPKTLASELQSRNRLPYQECVDLALKLATALAHLHQNGLIHRDIKPANIIFVNSIPKLADIGLVSTADATFSFVGTEGYLPPEGPGTAQADIFSLGKVIYEMATGKDRKDFPELPTFLSGSSEKQQLLELNEIIVKACASNAKDRYQAVEEMIKDLQLLQAGESLQKLNYAERRLSITN